MLTRRTPVKTCTRSCSTSLRYFATAVALLPSSSSVINFDPPAAGLKARLLEPQAQAVEHVLARLGEEAGHHEADANRFGGGRGHGRRQGEERDGHVDGEQERASVMPAPPDLCGSRGISTSGRVERHRIARRQRARRRAHCRRKYTGPQTAPPWGFRARSHLVAPRQIAHRVQDLRLPPERIRCGPCSEPPRLLVVRIPRHADGHAGFPGAGLAMRGENLVALAETDQVRGAPGRHSREQHERQDPRGPRQERPSGGPATHGGQDTRSVARPGRVE